MWYNRKKVKGVSFYGTAAGKSFTYADLLSWEDDARYELIEGEPVMMVPGPSTAHQDILGELFAQLHAYLKGKRCKAYLPPFDVRLFEEEGDRSRDVDTVVQPGGFTAPLIWSSKSSPPPPGGMTAWLNTTCTSGPV